MKTSILFSLFFFLIHFAYGQSLEQQVIGTTGNFSSNANGTTLSATSGEVVTTTESSNSAILTQGFQQPVLFTTAIHQIEENRLNIGIFPNPTAQQISIKKEHQELLYAELVDVLGRVLSKHDLEQRTTQIDLQELPSSTYFLTIKTEKGQSIQTFKIQKIQ